MAAHAFCAGTLEDIAPSDPRILPILRGVAAVSFDFFNTLATHRYSRGRGALITEYFRARGWGSNPWEHAALYDVFAAHGDEFAPNLLGEDPRAFCSRVARTLFRRLQVDVDPSLADEHAIELWRLLGPEHLAPFPESTAALRRLAVPPERVLHVGDSETDDINGARAAGLQALWLRRGKGGSGTPGEIRSLDQLAAYLPAV